MGAVQLGLFGSDAPAFDAEYRAARRIDLGSQAWVEHQPGWLSGHAALFEHLERSLQWRESEQQIYDRTVATPRLIAMSPEDGPSHPLIESMCTSLSRRYGEPFQRISFALYRDGRDSVAFHGDRIARTLPNALVATISLGSPRRFLMRPHGGGRSRAWNLGWGDLFVMGGSSQRTWQHGIPKVAHAGPRIAIMFRPHWEESAIEPEVDP